MRDNSGAASEEIYAHENTLATERLAQASIIAGIRHFVFMSTAKVYGNYSPIEQPFRVGDPKHPKGPYENSKHLAEEALLNMDTGDMAVSIVRPPLVYGPGVGANFATLIRLSQSRIPLPLGTINNKRSLVSTANLQSLILRLISAAKGKQIFNVSDGEDISTSELIKLLASANGHSASLLNVPHGVLEQALRCVGRRDVAERICGNFQVSIAQTCDSLHWQPPCNLKDGIRMSVKAVRNCSDETII
jgi:nucleoside-diphosphate-sugar epimerase